MASFGIRHTRPFLYAFSLPLFSSSYIALWPTFRASQASSTDKISSYVSSNQASSFSLGQRLLLGHNVESYLQSLHKQRGCLGAELFFFLRRKERYSGRNIQDRVSGRIRRMDIPDEIYQDAWPWQRLCLCQCV